MGIATIFAAVAVRSIYIQSFAHGRQPDALREDESPTAGFSVIDRTGRPLATSVECFDVTVSPQALWRSHTPRRMCEAIAEILDGVHVSSGPSESQPWQWLDVLDRTMPRSLMRGMLPGRVVPEDPRFLLFGEADLDAVRTWLDTGTVSIDETASLPPSIEATFAERSARGPIRGLMLVPLLPTEEEQRAEAPRRWTLALDPVECFSVQTRTEQLGEIRRKNGDRVAPPPERWTTRLLDDLVALIGPDRVLDRFAPARRLEVARLQPIERRLALRDALWAELLPARFRVLARGIDPVRAHDLRELMQAEAVSRYQLQLIPRLERRHPTRPGARPVAPDPRAGLEREEDAFALLGHWGVLDEKRATFRALRDREQRPHVLPWEEAQDPFEAYRQSLVVETRPWSGVELLCQTELENGPWAADSARAHAVEGRRYTRRLRHVARDRRPAWKEGVPNYFEGAADGGLAPVIEVTLDAHLQETLHRELGDLMESQRPALAMGIAVDIQTGDVLALDSASLYPYSGFAPVRHVFTPGSTFKAIIMALALDAGVTTPTDEYDTYAGSGLTIGRRSIGEAEGAPTEPRITAAEGLAFSCNAVLVQIALKMDAAFLRERLLSLGYAQAPGAGLGPELPGTLPPLVKGTWNRTYAHASVAFGHEVGVTLWQHAEALATLLRGGVSRPLRLLRSMERDGEIYDLDLESGERVFSESTCRTVREMMAMGANIGTGRHIAAASMHPEFDWIGTKTGTTEKVGTELCVHLELEALAKASAEETAWTSELRARLRELPKPHRKSTCYTSSICAAGSAMVDGERREIMVLIVADDAMGKERFGSRVTGPTAIAVLRQAFGFDREAPPADAPESLDDDVEVVIIPEFRADWLKNDLPWADVPGEEER
ncbi:penicillin-binding transpeptidase domain-containing protein [Saltatorellus ferox]|uniref:penicillin-binding transpeptidase domain-containing protein n=1 Tax=Saltatorellus ferox TaxID=2528018 RepID=UPI003AF3CE3C